MAVCLLFGPSMAAERTIFLIAESFGLWDLQLWSQDGLEPFGELLEAPAGAETVGDGVEGSPAEVDADVWWEVG